MTKEELKQRSEIDQKIRAATNECMRMMITIKCHPSPQESSFDDMVHNIITKLIVDINPELKYITEEPSINDIIMILWDSEESVISTADDLCSLEGVDEFINDNGETNYRYFNYIYLHSPTRQHICIETQLCARSGEFLAITDISTVEKVETISYKWI